jgi:L-ribulose-5-phosphate 3-epimerase
MTVPVRGVGVMDSVIGGADDAEVFARAHRAGADCVEITPSRAQLQDGKRLPFVASAAAASGLPVSSLVLDHHNLGGVADADGIVARQAADDVRAAISWAAELDAGVILVPFFGGSALVTDDDLARAARAFRELCEPAARGSVTLCYEGPLPARRILRLAELVASPAFGCYFDFANPLLHALDTATEIRELGELIAQVHLKDVRARKNDAHLGCGRVDLVASIQALNELGFAGWTVLETPAAPPPVVARDISRTRLALGLPSGEPRFGAIVEAPVGPWEELARRCAGKGLSAVQLDGAVDEPERARAAFAAHGVTVDGLACYRNLVHPDARARRDALESVRASLELAPALDTWVVATGAGSLAGDDLWSADRRNWTEDAWAELEQSVEDLLPVAERAGTVLALEHHVATVLRTPTQLLRLLERFPSEHLQIVCDPYNLFSVELMPAQERLTREYLALLEDRFVLAHLKDVAVEGAHTTRPAFGAGGFEQGPYLDFLRRDRPDLALIVEHLPPEEVEATVALIRARLKPAALSAQR